MLREEAARRRAAEGGLMAPRLARHVAPGQTVDLDISPQQRTAAGSAAKVRSDSDSEETVWGLTENMYEIFWRYTYSER